MDKRSQILAALAAFIRQRPGLDFGNYCSGWNDKEGRRAYFSEMRSITRDLQHARTLLRAVELRPSIDEAALRKAFRSAFSGRLSIVDRPDGAIGLHYVTGQYWPTEYRRAACAVLASALWAFARANMPAPSGTVVRTSKWDGRDTEHDSINGKTPGEWLRDGFRREYGRGIAARWFD